jgi:hypothetical protein
MKTLRTDFTIRPNTQVNRTTKQPGLWDVVSGGHIMVTTCVDESTAQDTADSLNSDPWTLMRGQRLADRQGPNGGNL